MSAQAPKTSFRFDMMPWKLVFCDKTWGDCGWGTKVASVIRLDALPTAPEPGRIPPGVDHVHVVAKYSGERDARDEEKWRALVKAAARCRHGRIMGNRCTQCPEGIAPDCEGNLLGYTMSGKEVRTPAYEDLNDIQAWIRD